MRTSWSTKAISLCLNGANTNYQTSLLTYSLSWSLLATLKALETLQRQYWLWKYTVKLLKGQEHVISKFLWDRTFHNAVHCDFYTFLFLILFCFKRLWFDCVLVFFIWMHQHWLRPLWSGRGLSSSQIHVVGVSHCVMCQECAAAAGGVSADWSLCSHERHQLKPAVGHKIDFNQLSKKKNEKERNPESVFIQN